jgi:putative membrane protein
MNIISKILIVVIVLEHLYFMYFEMFAWETIGKKTFKSLPEHLFKPTKGLAANQGLYNGFLAAGLIWSLFITDSDWSVNIATFFLSCIIIAGVYGAISASRKIFYIQAMPAIVTLTINLIQKYF